MDTVLSLVVLAALALLIAAFFAWRRGNRQQAALMAILALVGIANVMIWTVPDKDGASPVKQLGAAKPAD